MHYGRCQVKGSQRRTGAAASGRGKLCAPVRSSAMHTRVPRKGDLRLRFGFDVMASMTHSCHSLLTYIGRQEHTMRQDRAGESRQFTGGVARRLVWIYLTMSLTVRLTLSFPKVIVSSLVLSSSTHSYPLSPRSTFHPACFHFA